MMSDNKKKSKESQQQELRISLGIGGKKQKASGAMRFNKGDVRSKRLLVECKRTNGQSLSIKKEWLVKISNEAIAYHLEPALAFEIGDMPPMVSRDWIAVPAEFLYELLEAVDGRDED